MTIYGCIVTAPAALNACASDVLRFPPFIGFHGTDPSRDSSSHSKPYSRPNWFAHAKPYVGTYPGPIDCGPDTDW